MVHFPDVKRATEAVIEIMNQGVGIRTSSYRLFLPYLVLSHPPSECVELLDSTFMAATNKYGQSGRKWPEKDSLFFKLQGPTARSLWETAGVVKKITEKYGGSGFSLAKNDKEAADLWADRKNALYSGLALVPGSRGWSTDVW